MITLQDSLPKRTTKAILGLEVLWSQFNDVSFYIEDEDQQNFYLCILRKFFPNIKISKIFPLNCKDNVIKEARKTKSKKKVFIVDQDFDEICKRKVELNNLFYLKKYSIENYLVDKKGIYELIKEDKPRITDVKIEADFCLQSFKQECINIFQELSINSLLINKFELGIKYLQFDTNRDCDTMTIPHSLKPAVINNFKNDVEQALAIKRPRMKYLTQVKKHLIHFNNSNNCLNNIPGKYLLSFLKHKLKSIFKITQVSMESFVYRLGKNSELKELKYLQLNIGSYIK